jgi:hypothetical protein
MAITIIKRKARIRRFLTYDLEWIPGSPSYGKPSKLDMVRVVGCYDGHKGYRWYRTVREFLRAELNSENRGAWFFAHAGGMADVQFILEEITRINMQHGRQVFEVKASFSGSSAIIVHVKFKNTKNVYHFIDSYWLLKTSLEKIGKFVGLEKLDADQRLTRAQAKDYYTNVSFEKLVTYNQRDCEILWRAIDQFEHVLLDLGSQLQMTQASCAMQLFRRRYLKQDIPTSDRVNEISRKSYFASRVEVFQTECEDASYYDVNSSFPHAMTFPCPGRLSKVDLSISDDPKELFIANADVEVPESHLTPLPFRDSRAGNRVFFPSGRWRNWITSVDLQLLLREGGTIHKVHEVMHFEPMDDLAEYARDLYKMRTTADGFEKEVYKITLNSLYGKFAESPDKTTMHIDPPRELLERLSPDQELFPGCWLVENQIAVPHMHVPISTHITAFARRTLYDLLGYCSGYYYCDTDGLCVDDTLQTGTELGQIKIEKFVRKGQFVQAKLYRLEGKDDKGKPLGDKDEETGVEAGLIKAKGFSKLTVAQFLKLLEGESIDFERMARIRDLYRRGQLQPEEIVVRKMLCADTLPKRFLYPDGRSRPWTIQELKSGTVLPRELQWKR